MTPEVIKVAPSPDFIIEAEFADGQVRRLDMRPFLAYPALAALQEPGFFMRAHVRNGTVAWSEQIDLSPDTLYLRRDNRTPPPASQPVP